MIRLPASLCGTMHIQQLLQFPNGNGKYQTFDCKSDCKSTSSLIFGKKFEYLVSVKFFQIFDIRLKMNLICIIPHMMP